MPYCEASLPGGAAVAIPLPRLGAMLNGNGTAYAAGTPIQRFGVFFIGNGVVPSAFAPKPRVTGPLGALTLQLQSFEPVKSKLTVVSGFDLHTGRALGVPHGHFAGGLTGAPATDQSDSRGRRKYQLPSIDQVIAAGPLGKCVPYKSLEISVSNATPGVGEDIYRAVSGGPSAPNYPSSSPTDIFNRLFAKGVGASTPAPAGAPVDHVSNAEKSVLDAVLADADKLQKRLGSADRDRLNQHLESIRALERRIMPIGGGGPGGECGGRDPLCAVPKNHADGNDKDDGLDGTLAATMSDLLVMAMACDMTRVFTYQLTKPARTFTTAARPV